MNQSANHKIDGPSLRKMELDLRAYSQYMNYLTQHHAKGVKTVTLDKIPIGDEINVVAAQINDLKIKIKETRLRIDFQYHHHLN